MKIYLIFDYFYSRTKLKKIGDIISFFDNLADNINLVGKNVQHVMFSFESELNICHCSPPPPMLEFKYSINSYLPIKLW